MAPLPAWVGPTVAVSLVVIAVSFLVMGGVVLAIGLALRKESRAAKARLSVLAEEARIVTRRLKGELEGFADLSADARRRLKGAIDSVDGRLRDLDALIEVLHEEAEAAALDVAAVVRTVRQSGRIIGMARSLRAKRQVKG